MIRLIKNLFLIVFPTLLFIGGINYFIDPAHLFYSRDYVDGMAQLLTNGHNIDNVSNYDERSLQEQVIKNLKKTPDVVVLGSRRIMMVGSSFFPGKTVLNCGVSHANIRDIIAITGLMDSMNRLPSEVFINVDVGLISNDYSDEWKKLEPYYDYFMRNNAHYETTNGSYSTYLLEQKVKSILSVKYMQAAIDFALRRNSTKYKDVGSQVPVSGGRFADGTIAYDYDYTHGGAKQRAAFELETGKEKGVAPVDEKQKDLLLLLLDYYSSRNISVTLCMMPYHPSLYQVVNQYHDKVFLKYEDFFRNTSKTKNTRLIGSFNPAVYEIPDTMFYDMYHCSRQANEKVILK